MVLFTSAKSSFITQPLFVVKTSRKHCATTFIVIKYRLVVTRYTGISGGKGEVSFECS